MQSYFITDAQIESSSNYGAWLAQKSRLLSEINAWRPSNDNTDQWISVNLYRQTQVTGVVLQGAYGKNWWVKTYKVAHSLDNEDKHFEFVEDEFGDPEVCKSYFVCLSKSFRGGHMLVHEQLMDRSRPIQNYMSG